MVLLFILQPVKPRRLNITPWSHDWLLLGGYWGVGLLAKWPIPREWLGERLVQWLGQLSVLPFSPISAAVRSHTVGSISCVSFEPDFRPACSRCHFSFLGYLRKWTASYPDVSLLMKMCAQRKAGRRQRPAVGTLPMVPCGLLWSPVTRFALSSAIWKTKCLRRRLESEHYRRSRMNNQSVWKKKNPENKFRLNWESNPDLYIGRTQCSIHWANQASWRANPCDRVAMVREKSRKNENFSR